MSCVRCWVLQHGGIVGDDPQSTHVHATAVAGVLNDR
jgi:hypothetical protein